MADENAKGTEVLVRVGQVIKHGVKKRWEGKEKRPGGADRLGENEGLKGLKGSQ